MNISVYIDPGSTRSKIVGDAIYDGIRRCGFTVEKKNSVTYRTRRSLTLDDVAVFYGLSGGLRRVFQDYRERGRAFYIDLGYWGRRKRTRWDGYHKIILNSRHPTAYFQNKRHPNDRFASFRVPIKPWREPNPKAPIIVAGMSAKAAGAEGFAAESWERATIAKLVKLTDRRIIYRPKPNWPHFHQIAGAKIQTDVPLKVALADCHAVVAHHSNVCVDALLEGVPVFCVEGAAMPLATPLEFLHTIDEPKRPDGREAWAADLAYCQWSLEEMQNGLAWRGIMDEGLLG